MMRRACEALSALLALGLLADVCKFRSYSVALFALGCVCAAVGRRLEIGKWPLAAFTLAVSTCCYLFAQNAYDKTRLASGTALALGLALGMVQCLMLLRRTPPTQAIPVACLPVLLTIAAGNSFELNAMDVLVVSLIQILLLAIELRLRIKGSAFSWLAVGSFIPAVIGAMLLARVLLWSETKVNLLWTFMTPSLSTSFAFPSSSRLNSMLRAQRSPLVVLRYFGAHPPQYLMGRCYNSYEKGTWRSTNDRTDVHGEPVQDSVGDALFRYPISSSHETGTERDQVELAGNGLVLFIPRDLKSLTTTSPVLEMRFGESLTAAGSFASTYQLERIPNTFLPLLQDNVEIGACMALPDSLDPVVSRLAHEWTARCKTDLDRAKVLTDYFQDHFKYGFGYPFNKSDDPVAEFLLRRPQAHCELFASSLALMLRTLGIASRYINGFVIKEHSPGGEYSLVRARDAHAWVEAFVRDPEHPKGRWLLLDPTPPEEIQPPEGPTAFFENLVETLFYYIGRMSRLQPKDVLDGLVGAVRHWGGWAIALLALWYARKSLRPWWRRQLGARKTGRAALILQELPALFARVEQAAALAGLRHEPDLTPLRWADHLNSAPRTVEFLRVYSQVRYGQAAADVTALAEEAIRELRKLQAEARSEGRKPRP
jgi:transglutaminase-like putative cysteine protease